ncbi:glutathione peroxidase [Mycobacterium talmoniae]|uniref:Glutathione peroxidase n=1 Tax=Mycobacterium talmoniae TaxID=1858794 RepID=A0A1S1NJE6_9MYCO|nr:MULTISPECIES: glutathione peroxidase [Mycobacterium]OHV06219.1 glutathione peroxidase [Mycobacterium talmoniae]PQM48702.1 Hydroperoxy fatty acid reductase gpx1 [Mycobacterium talmoniae]TDH57079.1 glutathione peroxidase [Mycobacterium eburneum]
MTIHEFSATTADGVSRSLDVYAGRVVLIVNVASKCGFTPQYEGLEALYQETRDRGLEILGFPCNQFGAQEPGTDAEIQDFCATNFGVTFPVFGKIEVNGPDAHPLFVHLRAEAPGDLGPSSGPLYEHIKATRPEALGTDEVKWNFTKFLVGRDGKVIRRFEPTVTPEQIKSEMVELLV